jgi:hypothetical protein
MKRIERSDCRSARSAFFDLPKNRIAETRMALGKISFSPERGPMERREQQKRGNATEQRSLRLTWTD